MSWVLVLCLQAQVGCLFEYIRVPDERTCNRLLTQLERKRHVVAGYCAPASVLHPATEGKDKEDEK